MSSVLLEKPEQELYKKVEYASTGSRFIALFVDTIIVYMIIFILAIIIQVSSELYTIAIVLAVPGYFILLEGLYGQTLGKKLTNIKVVKEDGTQCDIKSALIRNLLRIIDALPAFYIIGLFSIAKSDKEQRIGDRVAKTVVIKNH